MLKAKDYDFDYISLSDQDDVWDEDKLQIAINYLSSEDDGMPLLYESTSRVVREDLTYDSTTQAKAKEITFYNAIIQTFSAGHTYVLNRKLLSFFNNSYDSRFVYAHDSFLNVLASLIGKVVFDQQPHVSYRQHNTNQIGNSQKGFLNWLSQKKKQLKKGDGLKYAKQITYFSKSFDDLMNEEQRKEMQLFNSSQKSFFKRVKYNHLANWSPLGLFIGTGRRLVTAVRGNAERRTFAPIGHRSFP